MYILILSDFVPSLTRYKDFISAHRILLPFVFFAVQTLLPVGLNVDSAIALCEFCLCLICYVTVQRSLSVVSSIS
jgi:hypothetical protein